MPLFFSKRLFHINDVLLLLYYLIPFCFVCSAVYVINDINDIEKDKLHPKKKKRPLASGEIKVKNAKLCVFLLFFASAAMLSAAVFINGFSTTAVLLLVFYFIINIMYSRGLKNIPILDIVILASGYLIRLFYGAAVIGVEVSEMLYITALTGALYLGMGKRRNEMKNSQGEDTRKVLTLYNYAFLDKMMHICLGLTIVFYALWTLQTDYRGIIWTIPFVIVIMMKYSLDIESEQAEGNPMDVILGDKILISVSAAYALTMLAVIYMPQGG